MTLEELEELIVEITKKEVSSLVKNQIKNLIQEGYTYKEIGRCVYYFFMLKQNDINKIDRYGIGIVRTVRAEANAYYDRLKDKQEQRRNAAEESFKQDIEKIEIIPRRRIFSKKEVDIDGI